MTPRTRRLRAAGAENRLIISASDTDSDLYYATGFLVGDPLIYCEVSGRKVLLTADLEYGRARREADVDEVVSTAPHEEEIRAQGETPRLARVADLHLRKYGVRELVVPSSMPLGHAEQLRKLGYELSCPEDPFFPERVVKHPEEVEAIEATQRAAEEAMAFFVEMLRKADVRGGVLHRGGTPLTAEWLRREGEKLLLELDCLAVQTIVAGGDQACDPHERGHGPLSAGEPIIIDIFPRSLRTRYWGDISRTVLKGKASSAVRKLHADVLAAQEHALRGLRDGACGQDIHQAVVSLFEAQGNPTEDRGGQKTGFIHSTGHGVGLDVHEPPRIGKVKCELHAGNVVTVEPGLYYPGTGAVRIEDLVLVTRDGHRNLTRFPKDLEL